MFAEHTVDSIVALANLDKGVTDRERDALQMVLLGKRLGGGCAVVKYKVAAQRLGLSVSAVKKLVETGRGNSRNVQPLLNG